MDDVTALTQESEALLADVYGTQMALTVFPSRLRAIETAAARRALEGSGVVEALNGAYRERARLVAALIRTNGYPAEVVMAPDTEGWFIVYAETPAGQVSWHIGPDDMDLFRDWPVAFGSRPSPWDGHDTDEKYRRVAALPRPEEPRVERCAACGVGRWVIAHDPEAGPSYHPYTPEAR